MPHTLYRIDFSVCRVLAFLVYAGRVKISIYKIMTLQ